MVRMELVVLGCSGSVPGPQTAASGYLVTGGNEQDLLLDCGSGVLAQLQREAGVQPQHCHVVFSHLHADHCSDFPSLLIWRRWHPQRGAQQKSMLLGPSITHATLSRIGADHPDVPDDISDSFEVLVHQPGHGEFAADRYPCIAVGEYAVYSAPAVHNTEAYLTRVEHEGRSLVYTGDTAWTDTLVDFARGADVMVAEATWGASSEGFPPGMHMSGAEAGIAAARAGVGRLILTHIPPWSDGNDALQAAREHFAGPVELAAAGMRIEI